MYDVIQKINSNKNDKHTKKYNKYVHIFGDYWVFIIVIRMVM